MNKFQFLIFIFLLFVYCSASNSQINAVNVRWDTQFEPDLAGFKIYYGDTTRNYDTVVDVDSVYSYIITGLVEGKTYYFVATAYDTANNESGFSIEVSAFIPIPDTIRPDMVTNIQTTVLNQKVVLTWNPVASSDLMYYEIRYGTHLDSLINLTVSRNVTQWVTPDLIEGQLYYFMVSSIDSSNLLSDPSAIKIVTIPIRDTIPPGVPRGFHVEHAGSP